MLKIKPGKSIRGIRPEIVLAACIIDSIYANVAHVVCVITSCTGGTHGRGSLHYVGAAIDVRTSSLSPVESKAQIRDKIAEALGEEFDVVLEPTHIHVEFQPKVPING